MTARTKQRLLLGLWVLVGVSVFVGANVHLLWNSLLSQPDCVPHAKAPGQNGQFRAAQSSC
ncbi:hypothetical protein C7441_108169 [Pseudaminobacter salicylatoxidans]|uniref:Uncharacterized protein n=1 Tax=Pseudaminobacter salicylatoxidans TaxID=93369 RepID=A0A316C216_PSESE|nr:hypothetical protein [Pseudaminobacter salicylatoxidans]PWJ83775.1 hypothetical protein C7441_108169 [Pseudaminobacter salicylatoxidans]